MSSVFFFDMSKINGSDERLGGLNGIFFFVVAELNIGIFTLKFQNLKELNLKCSYPKEIGMNKTKIDTSYIATKSLNLVEVPV